MINIFSGRCKEVKLDKSKDSSDKKAVDKRESKLKIVSVIGLLALLALILLIAIKNPSYFSYKMMEQKLTEKQSMEVIRIQEQYPEARQIRIRIDEEVSQ